MKKAPTEPLARHKTGIASPLYFDRQVVRAEDLTLDRASHSAELNRLRHFLHGWGVVAGFIPRIVEGVLTIGPGYGVTPSGRELYLGAPMEVAQIAQAVLGACGPADRGCELEEETARPDKMKRPRGESAKGRETEGGGPSAMALARAERVAAAEARRRAAAGAGAGAGRDRPVAHAATLHHAAEVEIAALGPGRDETGQPFFTDRPRPDPVEGPDDLAAPDGQDRPDPAPPDPAPVVAWLIARPGQDETDLRAGLAEGCAHPANGLRPARACAVVELDLICALPESHQMGYHFYTLPPGPDPQERAPSLADALLEMPPALPEAEDFLVLAQLHVGADGADGAVWLGAGGRRALLPTALLQDWLIHGTGPGVYFVNRKSQSGGEHEVHRLGCPAQLPLESNRLYLGVFLGPDGALAAAATHFETVDGCAYCCGPGHQR